MKHVFVVHSHITHLISLAIIQQTRLSVNDVIMVSFDINFKPQFHPIPINYIIRAGKGNFISKILYKLKNINYSKFLDNAIAKLTLNDDFTLYFNYAYDAHRILMTNSKCVKFNFIEEGMDNYKKADLYTYTVHSRSRSFRVPLKDRLKYIKIAAVATIQETENIKLNLLPAHPCCYAVFPGVNYYVFSERAFPEVPLDRKLSLKFDQISAFVKKDDIKNIDDSALWIGDNVVNFYKVEMSDYINAIREGILSFMKANQLSKIYLKFHGRESEEGRTKTRQLFESLNIKTVTLEDSQSVELLLLNSNNCKVIGLTSSLLWYAAIMGHQSYSINQYLTGHAHLADDNVYWEKVHKL